MQERSHDDYLELTRLNTVVMDQTKATSSFTTEFDIHRYMHLARLELKVFGEFHSRSQFLALPFLTFLR